MDLQELKEEFINFILNESDSTYRRKVSETEYLTRCPFCGDSDNPNKGHLYLHIDVDENIPILYNCFKCGEGGVLGKAEMSAFGIDEDLISNIDELNKSTGSFKTKKYLNDTEILNFDYELPDIKDNRKINYLENRLNVKLKEEDIKNLKIITSLKDFLIHNDIHTITCTDWQAKMYEEKYIGFLSYGGSHILFRDTTDTVDDKYKWVKYPITDASRNNRIFYSIAGNIDIFSKDQIDINLSEGVFDIVSGYFNLGLNKENNMNIAVCGKFYIPVIEYLVNIGFVGSNINLNIFGDNDAKFNPTAKQPTDITYFDKILKHIKYCFGKTNIYYNTISKDIGVKKEDISLIKYQL